MIKILLEKKDDLINHIVIKGHAGYGTKGNDIVCASVSSITITSLNAIIKIDEEAISFDQSEGFIEVIINKHDKYIDIILENMISLLEELKKQYEKNIKIDRR